MTAPQIDEARLEQYRAMVEEELESGWLYDRLADQCRNPATAATLRDLAAAERDHAAHWAGLLGDRTLLERPPRPSWRTRWLALLARAGGLSLVVPRLRSDELAIIRLYAQHPEAGTLAEEEREHRAALGRLAEPGRFAEAEHGFASSNAASLFRASLFGFNDGLVSNLSLVAGVAGASIQGDTVLLAGVAGLLAGAFSMSAGEYLSVRSQAELLENQITKERLELELDPDEERAELLHIYRDKGVSDGVARDVVDELMKDPAQAAGYACARGAGAGPERVGVPLGRRWGIAHRLRAGRDRAGPAVHRGQRVLGAGRGHNRGRRDAWGRRGVHVAAHGSQPALRRGADGGDRAGGHRRDVRDRLGVAHRLIAAGYCGPTSTRHSPSSVDSNACTAPPS